MFSPRNVSPPTSANFPTPYSQSPTRPTTGFQDILVTVPFAGRLELHRMNIIPPTKSLEPPPTTPAVNAPPHTTLAKPSTSLPSSGLTHMMHTVRGNAASGLRARQSLKATWDIRKHGEWEDVKGEFLESSPVHPSFEQDWLSEAELSTGTTSLSMLPDSVYLSHQFSFYSLADDWQALLLRSVFELPCAKIEVRKEVEISPFPSSTATSNRRNKGTAESFVQGNANMGSPFDEPLASAIQARLDPPPSEPGVIPSYPNGLHVGPNSWRDPTLPLRHAAVGISDGVGEGLKQLRRELVKVAKSPNKNSTVRAPTALTFDEHDAVDVEDGDQGHHTQSMTEESSGGSESTLSTANVDPPDIWEEWREAEVANDVAEYEAFESLGLGIVGEMDEDQPFRRPDLAQLAKSKAVPQAGRRQHEL
ncbi:hypothetical protein BS47DRAFT_500214 [Hydnum rufescens UP504]|uniref:Uncharacterized protein n=1 Tax=Hydnum rufescens UP504 TaxID=1448309 RepID=A0A9P6B4L6_9AGAM|nr:hypothetical protein BS47DRAFT_500214 [Hydnum rufescens UP504]